MTLQSALWNIDLSVRLGILIAGHFAFYYWTRYVVAAATTGLSRFLRALMLMPLLVFFCVLFLPHRNEEFTTALYCICVFSFLTPCKICSFCMNRGQLVKAYDSGSTGAFVLALLFPVTVKFRKERVSKETEDKPEKRHPYKDVRFHVVHYQETERTREALIFAAQVIAKIAFMVALRDGRNLLRASGHFFWSDICFGWFLYANTSGIEDLVSLIVLFTLNLKLEHNFDRPWLSQSVQELWSRRYNLVFGTVLRDIVYDPICESCVIRGSKYFDRKTPSKLRKSIALFATFVASGFLHIYMPRIGYMSKTPVFIGLFFLASALVILFEEWMKHVKKASKFYSKITEALPSWFFQIYCMSIMFVTGYFLYAPEHNSSGLTDDLMDGGLAFLPDNWGIHSAYKSFV